MQLGDITEPKIDQSGPPESGEFIYVDISSVDNQTKRVADPKQLSADAAPSRARQRLRAGDVLVSMTRPNLNAVAIVPPELDGAVGSTGFHVLRTGGAALPRWLYYHVQSPQFVRAMSELVQGALYPAVRPRDIRAFETSLPDLDEQRRIVAEIEKQFSRLDEAVSNLMRVKVNLKRYKAAVLRAAVEGRLVPTEAELARRERRSYETGADLLHRILELRRTGRSKYSEPPPPETANLGSLPEGWVYATAEQITEQGRPITYGVIKLGENVEGGVPILRSSDVRRLKLDLRRVKSISPKIAASFRRTFLCGGEIVVTVRGTLGGVAVVPLSCRGFNISREVAMLALVLPEMAHAVASFIGSGPIERWLLSRTKGIAYTGINIETLRALPIPVPPLAEQLRIIADLERRMSFLNAVEAEVDIGLHRASTLRESALSSAFRISEAIG